MKAYESFIRKAFFWLVMLFKPQPPCGSTHIPPIDQAYLIKGGIQHLEEVLSSFFNSAARRGSFGYAWRGRAERTDLARVMRPAKDKVLAFQPVCLSRILSSM